MARNLVHAAKLDREVTILRRGAPVDDGNTEVPGAWAVLTTRLASIKPKPGREAATGEGRRAEAVMSFWMRSDEVTRTLTAADAVMHGGVTYQLVAPPMEVGRQDGIELLGVAGALPE